MPAGKVRRFAETEREARRHEAGDRRADGDAGHAQQRRDGRADTDGAARAPSPPRSTRRSRWRTRRACRSDRSMRPDDRQPMRVRELEGQHDVAVVELAPAELLLQRRLQDADHLPIDVVDRRGEEQQRADPPPIVADAGRCDHLPAPSRFAGRALRDVDRRSAHAAPRGILRHPRFGAQEPFYATSRATVRSVVRDAGRCGGRPARGAEPAAVSPGGRAGGRARGRSARRA